MQRKIPGFLIALSGLLLTSCPDPNSGTAPASWPPVLTIDSQAAFVQYKVSPAEWALWTNNRITSTVGFTLLKAATAEIYETFQDKFDFIFFMLNTSETPFTGSGGAYAESFQTKNDITGLGGYMYTFDNDQDYGSAGQLQHIVALYKFRYSATSTTSYLITGPIIHEIGHRWFNFSTQVHGAAHWPNYTLTGNWTAADGIFAGPWNSFAPVELYLMGLIDSNDASLTGNNRTYADDIISESGPRTPGTGGSQKAFRGLVVAVTPTDLTSEDIDRTNEGVNYLTSPTYTANYANFRRQTLDKATLKLDGLLDPDTKK